MGLRSAATSTHVGFYGHFASKEVLMAHAIQHASSEKANSGDNLGAVLASYLSPAHWDDVAGGCPMAALAADVRLRPTPARSAMTAGIRSQVELMEAALPNTVAEFRRREAIGTYSAMLGALILARAVDDPALSEEILVETRKWLEHQ